MASTDDGDNADEVGQRAREGVEHLQAAARELIAAARAALDVAEEVVGDPDAAAALVGLLGGLGDIARRARPAPSADREEETAGSDGRVERIRVV
jgi:hypothetical protein